MSPPRDRRIAFASVLAFIGTAVAAGTAGAATCGYPNGPATATLSVSVNEYRPCSTLIDPSIRGYIHANLQGLPSLAALPDGEHPGYCADLGGNILDSRLFGGPSGIVYTAALWSSLDPGLPESLVFLERNGLAYRIPWDRINYLINRYPSLSSDTWVDIQAAIWNLVHGCTQTGLPYECFPLRTAPDYFPFGRPYQDGPFGCPESTPPVIDIARVRTMVADATANGAGFVPLAGQKMAVVAQMTACSPIEICDDYPYDPYQVIFLTSTCLPCSGTVGNRVWHDTNANGLQDDGEPGIAGVTLSLTGTDTAGRSITRTTTTDSAGNYLFGEICPGTYTVSVDAGTVPAGLAPTSPRSRNGNDTNDRDSNDPFQTTVIMPEPPSANTTVDFGYTAATGCTRTIGYWKTHAGFGPQSDAVSPRLPVYLGTPGGGKTIAVTTAKTAYAVLRQDVYGSANNGITKLYAQLLAAKLNLAGGSNNAVIAKIISAADTFLAGTNYKSWNALPYATRQKVLAWQKVLDDFNNGKLGPEHCR